MWSGFRCLLIASLHNWAIPPRSKGRIEVVSMYELFFVVTIISLALPICYGGSISDLTSSSHVISFVPYATDSFFFSG